MHPAPSNLPLIPEGLLFIVGLATTALGIAITRTDLQFDWVPPQVYDFLRRYFSNPQAVFLGGVVSLVGAALAGLAGRRNTQPDNLAGLALSIPSFPSQAQDRVQTGLLRRDPFVPGALALATLCSGFLYWQLASQQYTHWDILLFFVGLALVGFAIHRLDKPEQASAKGSNPSFASSGQALPTFQPSNLPTLPSQARGRLFNFPTDLLASLGLAIFSIVINSIDLIRWDFSFVADEGEFFSAAHQVVNGGPWNFFNLTWVYNSHPALDSVYQGMVMKVVGDNVIGWRFSEVLVTATTAALIYLLGVALLGRLPALAAGIFIASSNYLMAFNRIAYKTIHT